MMDVETGPSVVVVSAGLTVDNHRNGLRCPRCTPGGPARAVVVVSMVDGPWSEADAYDVARRTVRVHRRGQCLSCGPDGCPAREWADAYVVATVRQREAPDGG